MQPKTAVCRNYFPLQIANLAYFQRKIQLSEFSAYPDGSPSQLIRIIEVLLYFVLLTYLITSWSRVLPQKLTGCQLVQKFPAFYGTRRFITAFKSARHLSLSWANSIQSMPPYPTSWKSILILSSHLRLCSYRSLSLRFPDQNPVYTSTLPP